ncbi:MAG: hypothetical protein LBI59_00460 [Candidatus Accumulibacter sp.]|nr:hypothetical protein [Accumulibacter sp.]
MRKPLQIASLALSGMVVYLMEEHSKETRKWDMKIGNKKSAIHGKENMKYMERIAVCGDRWGGAGDESLD